MSGTAAVEHRWCDPGGLFSQRIPVSVRVTKLVSEHAFTAVAILQTNAARRRATAADDVATPSS